MEVKWRLMALSIVTVVVCLMSSVAGAITNKGGVGINRDEDNHPKPIRFENEAPRYEDLSKNKEEKNRNSVPPKDRDNQVSGSGHYDQGFNVYGPPEESGYHHQGGHGGSTYVSTIPFGNHGERDEYQYYQGKYGGGHGGGVPYHHGGQHYGHDPHALALKGLLLPLAGVALLGAAAALVSNPILLQLGVISGRRRRSADDSQYSASEEFVRRLNLNENPVSYRERNKRS